MSFTEWHKRNQLWLKEQAQISSSIEAIIFNLSCLTTVTPRKSAGKNAVEESEYKTVCSQNLNVTRQVNI